MTIQFEGEPPKQFLGEYDGSDAKFTSCIVEQELFMRLSNSAAKKYCNCAIYQMELADIIGAFVSGRHVPPFPIELGTTDFGFKRPSRAKVFFARLRMPVYLAWYRWKCRHIRKENLLKYAKAPSRPRADEP